MQLSAQCIAHVLHLRRMAWLIFKFHEPVMGRRAFVAIPAASSLAFLAACGKEALAPALAPRFRRNPGGTVNYYINNPVCIDPYNVQERQGTVSSSCLMR